LNITIEYHRFTWEIHLFIIESNEKVRDWHFTLKDMNDE